MEENKVIEQQDIQEKKEVTINADELAKFNETHVSKEEYDRIVAEKDSMVKAILEGQNLNVDNGSKDERDIKEYIEAVNKEGQTNLEYWENVLAYRDKVIAEGGIDPFVPNGQKIKPTDEDFAAAEKVANAMKDMVKRADGNPVIFNGLYQKEVQEVSIPKVTSNNKPRR